MGSPKGFDPVSLITDIVFSAAISAMTQGMAGEAGGEAAPRADAQAEAERQAEEREAQARKQQLGMTRQAASLGSSLGDGGSLAGQSMSAAVATQPQLKEKLGQ